MRRSSYFILTNDDLMDFRSSRTRSSKASQPRTRSMPITNDGFCIINDGFCIINDEFALTMMDFTFQMMNQIKAETLRTIAQTVQSDLIGLLGATLY